MAVLNADVLDAFLAAGVPDDKARKAAESLASNDTRISKLEQDLAGRTTRIEQEQVVGFSKLERQIGAVERQLTEVKSELKGEISSVKSELTVIKWMGGIIVAGVVAILTRLLFVGVV